MTALKVSAALFLFMIIAWGMTELAVGGGDKTKGGGTRGPGV